MEVVVIPFVMSLGKGIKMSMMRENESRGDLIAEELEKAAKGELSETEKVKVLAGERMGKKLFQGKQYVQGVKEYLKRVDEG